MRQIRQTFVVLLVLMTVLWLLADTLYPQPFNYFSLRAVVVQYSGVLAVAAMSVAMLLAARPPWLEKRLNGLDKMYRLHKWLGISALVTSALHWWWAQGSKWMVGWGWLQRPAHGPHPAPADVGMIESWLLGQKHLAESLGEWAFYVTVLLLVLALVKRFPYNVFRKTHKWLAVAYLVFAWHAVVLVRFAYWAQPVGWLLALLLTVGCVASGWVLCGRVGRGRRVSGKVLATAYYPELRVLETRVALDGGWPGHRAGQFAFVTCDAQEGAHPYTIASAWVESGDAAAGGAQMTFITKALGDHTRRLPEQLQPGAPLTVEGPYGCFDFEDNQACQIWVGAGIGITPFIARLQQLGQRREQRPVYLFHATTDYAQAAIDKLSAAAHAAGVQLHVLVSGRDGRLDAERIRTMVAEWQTASLWFCGPPALGSALSADFRAHGMAGRNIHQELFQMR